MHLGHASFNPYLVKEDILQYCKGLFVSIETNHALVEQSLQSMFPGNEDLKHHRLQPRDFIY